MSLEDLGPAPTSPAFLRAVGEELRTARARSEERFADLDPMQLTWKPPGEGWGVGECLEHLVLTNAHYLEHLEAGSDAFGPRSQDPRVPLRGSWFGRRFARAVGPDSFWRFPAPRALRPPPWADRDASVDAGRGPDSIVARFLQQQDRLLELLPRLEGLPLDRVRIPSPATRLVRLKASDALRILVAHQWRHLAQAERVLGHPGFPG